MVEEEEGCQRKRGRVEVGSSRMPYDITLDILTRLPPKSLFRFKCVCKDWFSLFQDEKFIKTYSDCCRRQEVRLLGCCGGSYSLLSIDLQHATAGFIETLPMYPAILMDDTVIPSCNGLFCLLASLGRKSTELIVWDPMADEILSLPKPDFLQVEKSLYYSPLSKKTLRFNLGIGFDTVSNRYKLVAGCWRARTQQIHVLTLGVDEEWRIIQGTSITTADSSLDKIIHLNGALYWFYTEVEPLYPIPLDGSCRLKSFRKGQCRITSFSLQDETFAIVPLPVGFTNLGHWLCESQGCLWLVTHDGNKLDLWWLKIPSSNSHSNIQDQWVNLCVLLPFELRLLDTVIPVRHGQILVQCRTCFYLCCYGDRGQLLKTTEVKGLPSNFSCVSKHEDSLMALNI